ncbi:MULTISPECIES: IS1096 element passenger TnpR family protein [unclassified Saccharicrinis]|uniref:IS1096 element passenger TnpR family protein n=1 Tax=unclassified Saccharicrinis TaxID=2646859 RepID=UPI003D33978F
MTIRLRIISGEDEDFLREIEISGGATFLELHNFIQKILKFDEGQMASFFMTDDEWQKNEEITLMDMAVDEANESLIMADTKLNRFIFEKKQRLLYVFDFFNERSLFIETYEIVGSSCPSPKCIRSVGEAPEQLDMSELLGESMGEPSINIDLDYSDDAFLGLEDDDHDDDSMISYTDNLEDL